MATYILKAKVSDLTGGADFNREISPDAETAGSVTVAVANGASETSYGFTKLHKPSNADWETGTIVVKIKVTTSNSLMFFRASVSRVDKAGAVQETSTQSPEVNINLIGTYSVTVPSMNWAAGNCDDRIRINYVFRSTNSHGGAISVVLETGTTTDNVTVITEHTGTCKGTFVKKLRQYKPDHKTIIAEGGTTNGDGISNNIFLDSLIASLDRADKLTHKSEREVIGTAFDNVVNNTARQIFYDPSSPKIRRSASLVYDSVHKRFLLFGGWNGTTRYNDVWELSADEKFGFSSPQWKQLIPTGTAPSARTTHIAIFDATGSRMIVHGGYDGADKNDTYALDVTTRYSEAWTTLSPTGTAPTARSQAAGAFKASTRKMYFQGGLVGANDYRNDLFELDLTTTNGAWTTLKVEDAAGNPPSRADHTMIFDSANNRLIIFAGYNGTNRLDTLWQWDVAGAAFTEINDGVPPLFRQMHIAVYDPNNPRMVMWGGRASTASADYLDDLWEFLTDLNPPAYFFDASDAAITDTQNAWINEANVVDADQATYGSTTDLTQSATNKNLFAEGTNAPANGAIIRGVRARMRVGGNLTAVDWGGFVNLTVPTGGWTWAKIQALEVSVFCPSGGDPQAQARIWTDGKAQELGTCSRIIGATDTEVRVYQVQIEVNPPMWIDRSLAAQGTQGTNPPGARGSAAAFDTLNKTMVIMGGEDLSLEENKHLLIVDCATDGVLPFGEALQNTWLQGRDAHGYAYNPDRDESLIFGGFGRLVEDTIAEGEHVNEFWIYDHANTEWYQPILNTQIGMFNREGATVIYDTNRDRYIIFGGLSGNNTSNNRLFNDTWELKASAVGALGVYTLTKLVPTGTKPIARWLHAAVYDATNDRMIIFGGDDGSSFRNDVAALSFSGGADGAWSSITPTGTAPSARRQAAYSIDTGENVMLISHGATGVNSFVGDTFKLTLTLGSEAWGSITGTGAPSARRGMTAIYRSTDDAFYFYGGYNGVNHFDELWKLTFGATPVWSAVSDTSPPAPRRSHSGTFSTVGGKILIYGGRDDAETSFNGLGAETWEYDVAGNIWTKKDPKIYIRGGDDVTGLAASTAYHWQSWLTGTSGLDSDKVSAFANAESATDFTTAAGQAFTQALNEVIALVDSAPKQAQKAANEVLLIVDSLARSAARTFSEVVAIVGSISNQAQKIFSEIVSIVDSLIRQTQKNLAEVVAIIDSLLTQSTLFRTFSEIITIADSLTKQAARSFNEIVTIVDSVTAKITAKIFEEVVVIADSIQRSAARTLNETVTIIDTKILQPIKNFIEIVVIADILLTIKIFPKELVEAISIVDSVLKNIGKMMTTEVVLVVDSSARLSGKNLQDTIIAADSIVKESRRNILESVLVADTSIRQGIKTFGEALTLADSFLRTWTIQRVFDEIVVIADALSRQVQKAFSEAVAIVDVAIGKTISKVLSEIVAVADAIGKQANRIFSEAVTVTDSIVRSAAKLLSDAVIIADILLAVAVIKKELVEAVLLVDSAIKSITKLMTIEIVLIADSVARLVEKNLQDAVIVTDSILKESRRIISEVVLLIDTSFRQGVKTLGEAVTLTDSFLRTLTIQRVFEEIVAVVDSVARQVQKVLNEIASLADSLINMAPKILSEIVVVADVIEKQTGRILSEIVSIADSLIRTAGKLLIDAVVVADSLMRSVQRSFAEIVSVADSLSRQSQKMFLEILAIADSIINQLTATRTFAEVVSITDAVLKLASRSFAEVVAVADSVIRAPQKAFSEAVTITDTAIKEVQRTFIEALSLADSLIKQTIRAFSESVIIADTAQAIKTFVRDLAEVIAVVDSVAKQTGRSLAEVVAVTDSLIRSAAKLASESIIVADTMTRQTARTLSEIVSIADTLARQAGKVLSDAISIVDSFIAKITAKIFTEAVIIADAIEKQTGRILSEIVAITDNLIRQTGKVLSDALTIIDTFARTISIQRILQEAVTIADSIAKRIERALSEIVLVTDSMIRLASKTLSEAVILVDSIIRQTARAFAEAVIIADIARNQAQKIFGEIISVIDSLSRQISRVFAEAVLIADSVSKMAQRIFQEIVSIADALIKTAGKALNEIVIIADSTSKQGVRTLSEIIAIADSVLKQGIKTLADTVLLADSIINQAGKKLSEAITIVDTMFRQLYQLTLSEIIAIADTLAKTPQKIFQEAVAIADAISKTTGHILSDAIFVADTIQKQAGRVFAEIIAVADSARATAEKVLKEAVLIVDAISKVVSFSRIYQEAIAIADSVLKTSAKTFAEAVSIADSFAKLLTRYANLNEIVQIADSIGRAISKIIEELIRITGIGDFKRLLMPGIKVAIQFLAAKIGILLMSTRSLIELKKEQRQTELTKVKQDIAMKSVKTGVEIQSAKKDITLYGQH